LPEASKNDRLQRKFCGYPLNDAKQTPIREVSLIYLKGHRDPSLWRRYTAMFQNPVLIGPARALNRDPIVLPESLERPLNRALAAPTPSRQSCQRRKTAASIVVSKRCQSPHYGEFSCRFVKPLVGISADLILKIPTHRAPPALPLIDEEIAHRG
jgi:hypothetical protein